MAAGRLIALKSLVAALPVLLPAVALADVYKCAGEGGAPVYQEMPVPAGEGAAQLPDGPAGDHHIAPARSPDAGARRCAEGSRRATARPAPTRSPAKSAPSPAMPPSASIVRLGMTEAEVLARLGPPDMTTGGKNGGAGRWTYMPAPGDPETITSLTFTKGVVTDIERKVVKK